MAMSPTIMTMPVTGPGREGRALRGVRASMRVSPLAVHGPVMDDGLRRPTRGDVLVLTVGDHPDPSDADAIHGHGADGAVTGAAGRVFGLR